MWHACIIVCSVMAIIAQVPTPTDGTMTEWGRLSVSAMCMALLGYIVIRVIPQMYADSMAAVTAANIEHTKQLQMVIQANREQHDKNLEANRHRTTELGRKIDFQTDQMVRIHMGQKPLDNPPDRREHST